ncbi:MAG TPA: class I SAM-dependent rRNA methyltransferase [Alphaproteobacteria bacterium]|nr:class I SAM-dependent rRNA methyltransferase [Alphaproteobacteria bacterium]
MLPTITLPKIPPRFLHGHPWLYSNEVTMDAAAKAVAPGSVVQLRDSHNRFLALAQFNPHSLIAARLLTRREEAIDVGFWRTRLEKALALRTALFTEPYYRLAHGEADGLPGLIIDRYGDVLVLQANTAGMDAALNDLLSALEAVLKPSAVLLRGDTHARALEGLPQENKILKGEIPEKTTVRENGVSYLAHLHTGQKTGWFYDQRRNRALAAELSKSKSMLDLYSHSGGFGLPAAKAGASKVVCVDSSGPALALAQEAAKAANFSQISFQEEDAFEFCATSHDVFDVVIADPPPFARSKKDVPTALKGYRKLARLSAARVAANGFLFIFSCSHAILRERFDEECLRGVSEAGRSAKILARTGADFDHPQHAHLPESAYLKGLLLQLD